MTDQPMRDAFEAWVKRERGNWPLVRGGVGDQLAGEYLNTVVNDWWIGYQAGAASRDGALTMLQQCLPLVESMAEETGYGFHRPDNPHDYSPDHESCSPEEIANHKAACEAFDRGEYKRDDSGGWVTPNIHLLKAPWGIGSYVMRDERLLKLADGIRAALATTKE